jgi:Mg2+ and Co2+ transporter CorA
MNLKCYQLKEASLVTAIPWHSLQALDEGSNVDFAHWVEVDNPTVEELKEGLQHLNLHPLILEDCFDPEHGTLVDRFPGAVYIELPANENGMFREVSYLSIICLPRLLVTIRRGDIPKFDTFVTTLQNDLPLESGNTSNLLYLIINFIIDKTTVRSLFYRKQLNQLERKLVQNPEDLDPEDMTTLNHQITQLESICEDQLLCAGSLVSHTDAVIETSGQEAYFQDLINDAEHLMCNFRDYQVIKIKRRSSELQVDKNAHSMCQHFTN